MNQEPHRKTSKHDPNKLFEWDHFSDQPKVIKNKAAKRRLYLKGATGSIKTFLTALLLPLAGITLLFQKRTVKHTQINSIGLCINIDDPLPNKTAITTQQLQHLINDLGVENLLIRLPLADIENLQRHIDFIRSFSEKKILVNILQDRKHIEDPQLLYSSLKKIFKALEGICYFYQIGNAVNRRKWAFISLDEYFQFFHVAENLRTSAFPQLKLIGANIIDFELPNFARALFHLHPIKYDATAALLYVDRRGAPENTQMGCDLISKINWFYALTRYSPKSASELWITETNWPLTGTEPFAPAVGDCMVNEELQATYLVRYYLLMIASGKVTKCFWHQLVAPGYGLVDNRNNIRKRKSYYSFKFLTKLLRGSACSSFTKSKGVYSLTIIRADGTIKAVWRNDDTPSILNLTANKKCISLTGQEEYSQTNQITIDQNVRYIIDSSVQYH